MSGQQTVASEVSSLEKSYKQLGFNKEMVKPQDLGIGTQNSHKAVSILKWDVLPFLVF